ncbi:hypothetical protein AMATHDRAFT_4230 [Amanita thiersii Skay4041]|uniref:Uncharacterized protein n=1 Tax=Amanita thiersii Skay4041 TaxID=703135 RepID=A0A2A9NPG5_9AGAR|nr:hypothetical protein AMATHDRAFT_4230 [Amanita thiersii Skay4041]
MAGTTTAGCLLSRPDRDALAFVSHACLNPLSSISAMPPRTTPKIHQLLLKTHKLTIFLTLPPTTAIAEVKDEALSALTSEVHKTHTDIDGIPMVTSPDQFELCRVARERDQNRRAAGMGMQSYEVLDTRKTLRDYGFPSWEVLFFQFKREGELLPVTVTLPSVEDDEIDVQPAQPPLPALIPDDPPPTTRVNKGKRKARPDESD